MRDEINEALEAEGRRRMAGRFGLAAANIIAEVSRQRTGPELLDPQTFTNLQAAVEAKLREKWWAGFFDSLHDSITLICPVCREHGAAEQLELRDPSNPDTVYYHIYRVQPSSEPETKITCPERCPASSLIAYRSYAMVECEAELGSLPRADQDHPGYKNWPTICPPLGGRPLIVPSPAQADPTTSNYAGTAGSLDASMKAPAARDYRRINNPRGQSQWQQRGDPSLLRPPDKE